MPTPSPRDINGLALPEAFKPLWHLDKNGSWERAIALLRVCGFELLRHERRFNVDWPEGLDPMAEPPEPGPQAKPGRQFALLAHPAGFLITGSSYANGNQQSLNSLRIHFQVDVGSGHDALRSDLYASGSSLPLPDGCSIQRGDTNAVTGHASLASILEACYRHGRPLPFEEWDPVFLYVEPAIYTPVPEADAHSFFSSSHAARLAPRVAADRKAFIQSLPPEIARVVDYNQEVVQDERPRREDAPLSPAIHAYLEEQLKASRQHWPSPSDSDLSSSWSQAISLSQATGEPLAIDQPGSRLACGSNALHLIAALRPRDAFADSGIGSDPALDWVQSRSEQELDEWLSHRDALGRTPVGVALDSSLRQSRSLSEISFTPLMDLLFRQGRLGAPGELGQTLYDALAPHKDHPSRFFHDSRQSLKTPHLRLIERLDARARELSHPWLAPLQAHEGPMATASEAIGALMRDKIGPVDGPDKAYLEAFELRLSIDSGKPAPAPAGIRL